MFRVAQLVRETNHSKHMTLSDTHQNQTAHLQIADDLIQAMTGRISVLPSERLVSVATCFQIFQKATEKSENPLQASVSQNVVCNYGSSAFDTVAPIVDLSFARHGSRSVA